jgi:hypothetical protein
VENGEERKMLSFKEFITEDEGAKITAGGPKMSIPNPIGPGSFPKGGICKPGDPQSEGGKGEKPIEGFRTIPVHKHGLKSTVIHAIKNLGKGKAHAKKGSFAHSSGGSISGLATKPAGTPPANVKVNPAPSFKK